MRIIGILLVIFGALVLGFGGCTCVTHETMVDAGSGEVAVERQKTVSMPPLAGGIAVVSGLILLATAGKRD